MNARYTLIGRGKRTKSGTTEGAMIDFDNEEDIRRLLKSVYKPGDLFSSPEFKERLLERLRFEVSGAAKGTAHEGGYETTYYEEKMG